MLLIALFGLFGFVCLLRIRDARGGGGKACESGRIKKSIRLVCVAAAAEESGEMLVFYA